MASAMRELAVEAMIEGYDKGVAEERARAGKRAEP
jgi:hypothetical protein